MALRNIVRIDEEKCNGCGQCIDACAEGAIEIIDGKAKLISEIYCDGLGACLGECPQDAITIEQREAEDFDEAATEAHLQTTGEKPEQGFQCPGSMMRDLGKKPKPVSADAGDAESQLSHWPVQLKLVSPDAPYFKNAHLLLAADCVPFALADFHSRLLVGKSLVIGCPKLDDPQLYAEKLAAIIKAGSLTGLTVVHMEVPCCFGLIRIATEAVALSGVDITIEDITVGVQGDIIKTEALTV